jgi:DNA-binding SARP family transcriptional activator/tetratricopeptide (TPR) repeat protein
VRFSLLGPLVVSDGAGGPIALNGPRLRVLLAALLLRANVPVSADEIAEMVWDGSPPPSAVGTLRSYIRRLRSVLGSEGTRIEARDPGYVMRVDRLELDVLEFEGICRECRMALQSREWSDASAAATRGLRLWRAAPLLDVPAEALRAEFVPRLERLRLQLLEDRFDAGLRLGHSQELLPELHDMTARNPLQERFHAQLMLALARSGRQAQALDAYQKARRVLVEELGIEPGRELRDIHRKILEGVVPAGGRKGAGIALAEDPGTPANDLAEVPESAPAAPSSADAGGQAGSAAPPPAQLPADIPDFTGRRTQLSCLRDALTGRDLAGVRGTTPIVTVTGVAGVGKTTLIVHAAHQVRDMFPDGQLYANLRGASDRPTTPGEVLARFLLDLGVDAEKIPAGEEERAALYRTRLTGRRVLILLDDAKDPPQVRPLLPASASCAVLTTSRSTALYLVGTRFVDLDMLPEPDARGLFSRIVGSSRSDAEPEAVDKILSACAGLPLAIKICAARLGTRGHWPIATMADRLRDERRRLDQLHMGDLAVRASFEVSYRRLVAGPRGTDSAHAFRLLGLWEGQRISLAAAAALIGEREEHVRDALERLVDANLLESPEPDWYQFHDLLRLFAAEQAHTEEAAEVRCAAVARLLQWYLETATAAADLVSPYRYRLPEEQLVPSPLLRSAADAMAWFDDERMGVMTAIRMAVAAAQSHDIAWRLPNALYPLFARRDSLADRIAAYRIAVENAGATGHRQARAWAEQNLGATLAMAGDEETFVHLEEALTIRREIGDHIGHAQTQMTLACAYHQLRGPEAAIGHSLRSVEMVRRMKNPAWLGTALNNHGDLCMNLGRLDEAAGYFREVLACTTGDIFPRGYAVHNLGLVHLKSARPGDAIACFTEAHRLHLASGDLMGQADNLKSLGEAQCQAGLAAQARESLSAALLLFESLGEQEGAQAVRSALTGLLPARTAFRRRRVNAGSCTVSVPDPVFSLRRQQQEQD